MDNLVTPDPARPGNRLHGLVHPRRWLAERRVGGENGSAFAFGARLFVAIALTFALVGAIGYVLVDRNLEQRQITRYAADVRADAHGFEDVGARAASQAEGIREIDRLLDAIARRPGTLEVLLIDQRHVVRAAGEDRLIGTTDADPRIDAALEQGRSYASRESDPRKDRRNFEFVTPVNLPGGRYAYEVTYDHRTYDAQLHEVRMVLLLVGLLSLLGGSAVFYLVGGRVLMRDHRRALERATRDGLTDLPNQRAFQDELPQAVASATRYQDPVALAVLDIDDFKFINDRHGHPHGDAVLRRVAEVLREARPGDRPYRIGGDEFALLLAHTDSSGARTLARRLSRSFADAGIEVSIGVSAMRPGRSESQEAGRADTLRAEADAALYEAKRQGGNRAAHFDDIRERVAVTTSEKKEAVRRLIDEGRLTTVFQPIWDFATETLLGVEALSRPDPSYGLSGPEEAFDIAEQIGRVHQLDVLCVRSALRVVPELDPGVLLFFNLSPQTLDLDSAQNDWVRVAVEAAGLPPERVVIEVTERFGGRTAAVVKCLQRLRGQGFKTALDDVGTGNSGLEMLRKVKAEFVKLDRSIVIAAPTEPSARAVLMAMATFARQTGAFVIAEGVEDEETLRFLRSIDDHDLHVDTVIQGGQGGELGQPSKELPPGVPTTLSARQNAHPTTV
ncbi:MAG TPA: bifunctional diguanylate cyclase/phosphodiesterase [Solirubrobacteraceae bacterium]|nr:bifunctional diguanylate cyclase/phosphodiesterase [Solirubrobacteraceae bacterium]